MFSDLLFDYLRIEASEDFASDYIDEGIIRDSYEISTDVESKKYNKPIGKYELLSIPEVISLSKNEIERCTEFLVLILKDLIGKVTNKDKILVVGLGNRHISSDSLGAKVVGKINITFETKNFPKVMAIAPSVMGLTGIETLDIVEGVVENTHPSHIIIIDSLCASGVERLARSIQVTNTGICPGGGIGNKRKCLDTKLAPNVYSIGVPLLIFASTFIEDAFAMEGIDFEKISGIMHNLKNYENKQQIEDLCGSLKRVLNNSMEGLIVSIKDIEESVEILSSIISDAINITLGVDVY